MRSQSIDKKITDLKEDVLNSTLVFGAMGAVMGYLVGLLKFIDQDYELINLFDLLLTLGVVLMTAYRNRLSIDLKSFGILAILFFTIMIDFVEQGEVAPSKVLLILIPFFNLVSLDTKKSLIVYLIFLSSLGVVAYLHISEKIAVSFELDQNSISSWVLNLALIFIVAFMLMQLIIRFIAIYEKAIEELVESNREVEKYKDHLESMVEKKTATLTKKSSELKDAHKELKHFETQLIQSDKMASLGLMASGVAHEINNPLNFIKSGAQIASDIMEKKLSKKDRNDLQAAFDAINEGVARADSIVSSLNRFGHDREGFQDPCSLNEIISHCITILNNRIKDKIEIRLELVEGLPIVNGNSGKLHQAFLNIINNGIQSMTEDGTLTIRTIELKTVVKVSVEDTGVGISEENLNKIFDPFFTTKNIGEGTGLGLYITRDIIESHKGRIKFTSKSGVGTKVEVTLPIAKK